MRLFKPMKATTYYKVGRFFRYLFMIILLLGMYSLVMLYVGEVRSGIYVT